MPITKDLSLKILGALAFGGSVVGGGIVWHKFRSKGEDVKGDRNSVNTGETGTVETGGSKNITEGSLGSTGANASEDKVSNSLEQKTQGASGGEKGAPVPNTPPGNVPGPKDPGAADTNISPNKGPGEVNRPGGAPAAPKEPKVLGELGLSCGTDNLCTLATGKKLSVKHDSKTRTLTALPSSGKGVGKIRIQKPHGGGGEEKSAFTIEDGDITPTWEGGDSSITKLEEFETYEVEEEILDDSGKKYHFKRRANAQKEMEIKLGLMGSDCSLPSSSSSATICSLDISKLAIINFEGKKEEESPSIDNSGTTTLTITKLKNSDDKDYSKYPFGYQFVLSGGNEVRIPATPSEIVKKANVSLGFRIKKSGSELSLEKVSQIDRLGWKLGLTGCNTTATTCKFSEKINVYKDGENNIRDGKITDLTNQIITYQGDVDGYEGGIKFTVSRDISFASETISGTFSKIDSGDYEAKQQTVNGQTHWYLTKR